MAVSHWALNPTDTACELDVPGIFCLKRDRDLPSWGAYMPWPLDRGPICEQCWLEDGFVFPVIHSACPHGGAPTTEVES
jgi:hypothetical protein